MTSSPVTDLHGPTRADALNDALERLADYRYLDGPGFACHGPMAAEALSSLGYDQEVAGWVERYKASHPPIPAPPTSTQVDLSSTESWQQALGDSSRISDWDVAFRNELSITQWPSVLTLWVARLLPGYAGGLTHGLLRVAHGVRGLSSSDQASPLMLDELAHGLAMWSATFVRLPGRFPLEGGLSLEQALAQLPRPASPWSPIEAGTFTRISELVEFPARVGALGPPASTTDALAHLSETFCRIIEANPDVFPVPLVHTVTPVAALRTLVPYLPGVSLDNLYAQIWQVNAAIISGFTPKAVELRADIHTTEAFSPIEIAARAVEHADAHVIKFAEAATREYASHPSSAYLYAAQSVWQRVPRQ
jgi:hypothetical protein